MEDEKRQHLEFIQGVITRMNTNSFQIKGMAVTVVSALLAIYVNTTNVAFIFLSISSTVLFWFLDSYYLQQERKFREIYNNVAGIKDSVAIKLYEMPIQKFQGGQYCFCRVFFSRTIVWLYGIMVVLLLVSGLILG
jgi:cytochrome b subunit of formate dehydrogenase